MNVKAVRFLHLRGTTTRECFRSVVFERGDPGEWPEDDEGGANYHCPCSRQLPEGHRIPWYTSGFT